VENLGQMSQILSTFSAADKNSRELYNQNDQKNVFFLDKMNLTCVEAIVNFHNFPAEKNKNFSAIKGKPLFSRFDYEEILKKDKKDFYF